MLALRNGWESRRPAMYLIFVKRDAPEAESFAEFNHVSNRYWAYPFGDIVDALAFRTIRSVHNYLISQGSESPWEEVGEA